jgi:hypothetical protein
VEQPKDTFATRVVVIALAVVVVGGLAAVVFLASTETPIPDTLDRLVFSALGAISALLAKTAVSVATGTTPVEITNTADAPVPVSETPAQSADDL